MRRFWIRCVGEGDLKPRYLVADHAFHLSHHQAEGQIDWTSPFALAAGRAATDQVHDTKQLVGGVLGQVEVAGPDLEGPGGEIEGLAHGPHVGEGAEVAGAVVGDAPDHLERAPVEGLHRRTARAVEAGIGLFIAFIGLQHSALVVGNPVTLVDLFPQTYHIENVVLLTRREDT